MNSRVFLTEAHTVPGKGQPSLTISPTQYLEELMARDLVFGS
jgi:hypothetical protein